MKRITGKSEVQKQAKTFINQYQQAFSLNGLREAVLEYHDQKKTEAELTESINSLSKLRATLEDENKKGKLQTTLPTLQKEEMKLKEKDLLMELNGIQNFVSFSTGN